MKKTVVANKNYKVILSSILLPIILIMGLVFRFYNATYRYAPGDESVRDAIVASVGATQMLFPLTGPFSSAGPFTFGPWYWYHLIVFKILLPVPYSPWILIGILSTVTIYVYYKIGEELVNKECGLLIAFLVALSPSHIISAFGLTNPNMIHLYAGLTFLLFIKSIKAEKPLWMYFLFGVVLGIGANIHYQMLLLFALPMLGVFFKKRDKIPFLICSVSGIVVTFIPLLYFDITNHWYTLTNFVDYSIFNKRNIHIPYRWLFYIRDFWPNLVSEVIGLPYIASVLLILGTGLATTYLLIKRKLSIVYYPLIILFIIIFFYLRYYDRERFFGYLHFLHPLLFIFVGSSLYLALREVKHKYVIIGFIVAIVAIFLIPKNIAAGRPDTFNTEARQRVISIEKKYPGGYEIYKCKSDSSEPYVSIVSSTYFLLDARGLLENPSTKLGFLSAKCKKENKALGRMLGGKNKDTIPNSAVDLTALSSLAINKAGYIRVDRDERFATYVFWWKEKKPM